MFKSKSKISHFIWLLMSHLKDSFSQLFNLKSKQKYFLDKAMELSFLKHNFYIVTF